MRRRKIRGYKKMGGPGNRTWDLKGEKNWGVLGIEPGTLRGGKKRTLIIFT